MSAPPQSRIRRLPLPQSQPPYVDPGQPARRQLDPTAAVQGTLALDFRLRSGVPAIPQPPPDLRLVPPEPATMADSDFGPQPTAREDLPEPVTWAARVTQAIVEVLGGMRPLPQLVRWTTSEVYEEIADLMFVPSGSTGRRTVLRSVHVTEPADGVAEVCAVVRTGRRWTALALRLEGLDGRWQCTALVLG